MISMSFTAVALPPGRLRLSTRPSLTGSVPTAEYNRNRRGRSLGRERGRAPEARYVGLAFFPEARRGRGVDELRDLNVVDRDGGFVPTCDDQVLLLGPVQFYAPRGYAIDATAG